MSPTPSTHLENVVVDAGKNALPCEAIDQLPATMEDAGRRNLNPTGISLCALLREDLRTHDGKLFEQGFWAIAVHRYGNWRMRIKPKLLRLPFSLVYKVLYKHVEWFCGISLPDTVQVGRRVRLWHHGGMILMARAIGDDAQVRQNTTFGVVRTDHDFELPIIMSGADIGVGACILGPVTVGRQAVIGANAVVIRDVPAGGVAVGIPAKVIKVNSIDTASAADLLEGDSA